MTTPGVALSGGGASPLEEARLNRLREPLPTDVASLPALPAAFARALDASLVALGVELAAGARAAIEGHVRLLLAWNEAINLTSVTDPAEVAIRHVADSLSALGVIRSGPHATLVDIGSGGGFPGLPLAAALPDTRTLLVDATAKKVAFLDAVRLAVGLAGRVEVAASRAEALRPAGGPASCRTGGRAGGRAGGSATGGTGWDVVTARAVGPLGDLVELALPLLAAGGRLVAWKRGDLSDELAAGGRAATALGATAPLVHEVPAALGLDRHVLVVVAKAGPTPPGYPRDPAVRKRRPW